MCDEFGIDNCKIELVEYCPCDTIEELRRPEGFHNRNTHCLNKQIAGQKHHEHYMDNIDIVMLVLESTTMKTGTRSKTSKIDHANNREKQNANSKANHERDTKEVNKNKSEIMRWQCVSIITRNHKARHGIMEAHSIRIG